MLSALLARWQRGREAREMRRHAIPDDLWQLTLARYPFLCARSRDDLQALRQLAALFLARKEFHGVAGFVVSDAVAVAVAAQACLPVLKLGLDAYAGFVGIVMHADEVVAQREYIDEDGIVHQYEEVLAGEAMEGGPLMLAWSELNAGSDPGAGLDSVYNVVIHEFAHVLDMAGGEPDGVPHPLPPGMGRAQWLEVIETEWALFCDRVRAGEATLIDPYGEQSLDEFFAVASEAFFVAPGELRREQPALYDLLSNYYRQNPATFPGAG